MTAQARLLGGRYQVGELLGYGGMAEVHKGRDLRLGRDVAIKMLRTDLARDATFQMRFRREAQNAASLNHPAIVAVYDTGEEHAPTGETLPFIVMEFVSGRTLKEVLAVENRLQPRRALEITADICAALEFSHRHGIIHRDIKPGNVMMSQNNQVKVMDFGIARALASGATTMTQTSAVIGTAQYLSPEQARGEAVDARSDVYAAGCVLYELLCGQPPFVGDNPVSVAYQHVREDPKAPSDTNRDVSPDVDAIVLKALAKNPINRYQSAAEMRADLLRAAAGRPVLATPVLREDETMAMAAAQTRQIGPATRQGAPARVGDPRRRRASAWVLATLAALGVLAVIALAIGLYLASRDNHTAQKVNVPGVINKTKDQAVADITKAGLIPQLGKSVKDSNCDVNTVTGQSPNAGLSVAQNSTVTYDICTGPDTVRVPNTLVNSTKLNADTQLTGLGLKPNYQYVNSTKDQDIVLEVQDAGKDVPKNSTILVKLSRGNLVEVPSVVGKSEADARAALENRGFDVNVNENGPIVAANKVGTVTSQNPGGGQNLESNSTVTITIGRAAPSSTPSDSGSPSPSPSTSGST
jgi:beta-lactam-binding protein with PASTA domain/predicted Ser/Thr protein kinase